MTDDNPIHLHQGPGLEVLEVIVQPFAREDPSREADVEETRILINGRDLIELVRNVERPFAEAEGSPEIAGSYAGLPPDLVFLPSRHLLGDPDPLYGELVTASESKTALLVCDGCLEPGCWPLCARIDIGDDIVTWSDFEQPHRRERHGRNAVWRYDDLGPFTFERAAYEVALRRG